MLYTLENVRDNLRNKEGQRVFYLGQTDKLTWEARDYLQRQNIPILPAVEARPEVFTLENGATMTQKPEHMTQLNREVLVEKTHPRILFRGQMDLLQSQLLRCGKAYPELTEKLRQLLEITRKILACEVLEQPLEEEKLLGMTPQELRKRSHFPQEYYGQPHFMPDFSDSALVLELNTVRCAVRSAELSAVAAFTTPAGKLEREDIVKALNRMSSAVYLMMLEQKCRK